MVSRDLNRCLTPDDVRRARTYRLRSARARREGYNGAAQQTRTVGGQPNAAAACRLSSRARPALAKLAAGPATLQIREATFLPECADAFPGQDRHEGTGPVPPQRGRYNQGIGAVHGNRRARSSLATTGRTSTNRPEKCRILRIPALCRLVKTPLLYYRTPNCYRAPVRSAKARRLPRAARRIGRRRNLRGR